jgi:hypothetical protein
MELEQRELKENHPVLEKIVSALALPWELSVYLICDLVTITPKNRIFPRSWKYERPWLSCRYDRHGETRCKHAKKYYHKFLFKIYCHHYDLNSGRCNRHNKKKP